MKPYFSTTINLLQCSFISPQINIDFWRHFYCILLQFHYTNQCYCYHFPHLPTSPQWWNLADSYINVDERAINFVLITFRVWPSLQCTWRPVIQDMRPIQFIKPTCASVLTSDQLTIAVLLFQAHEFIFVLHSSNGPTIIDWASRSPTKSACCFQHYKQHMEELTSEINTKLMKKCVAGVGEEKWYRNNAVNSSTLLIGLEATIITTTKRTDNHCKCHSCGGDSLMPVTD